MIILYGLFALFFFVTVIVPFYLIWMIVGLINPKTRAKVRMANSAIGELILVLLKFGLKLLLALGIALAWIEFLKWFIIDVVVVHFPP